MAFAEEYAHGDPQSAAVKLRSFGQELVVPLYQHHCLPRPFNDSLNDLLEERAFVAATPNVIQTHLHALRKTGSKRAHGDQVSTAISVFNRYKEVVHEEVEYESPKKIIKKLRKLEAEIAKDLDELEAMS